MKMLKSRRNLLLTLACLTGLAILMMGIRHASAEERTFTNSDTGYAAIVDDEADYLTDSEEKELLNYMAKLTGYTNCIYLTDDGNIADSEYYSQNLCKTTLMSRFGSQADAVIYLVDNNYDYIFAQNDTYDIITKNKAYTITDKVYTYSASGKYYEGAMIAFRQMNTLLSGGLISEPMRYICNGFLALLIAILVNFIIVSANSKLKKATVAEMISGSIANVEADKTKIMLVNTSRVYSPASRGGGGGGGHVGGGGGGGFHGGGGGHHH